MTTRTKINPVTRISYDVETRITGNPSTFWVSTGDIQGNFGSVNKEYAKDLIATLREENTNPLREYRIVLLMTKKSVVDEDLGTF